MLRKVASMYESVYRLWDAAADNMKQNRESGGLNYEHR